MNMYEIPEVKKENPNADKLARTIFVLLEDFSKYKMEGAVSEKIIDQLSGRIKDIQEREKTLITEETFKRIRSLATQKFMEEGGNDPGASYILDLLSEIEKTHN